MNGRQPALPMRLGEQPDPALQAATLALTRGAHQQAGRLSLLALSSRSKTRQLAPLGYLTATAFGVGTVLVAWFF